MSVNNTYEVALYGGLDYNIFVPILSHYDINNGDKWQYMVLMKYVKLLKYLFLFVVVCWWFFNKTHF